MTTPDEMEKAFGHLYAFATQFGYGAQRYSGTTQELPAFDGSAFITLNPGMIQFTYTDSNLLPLVPKGGEAPLGMFFYDPATALVIYPSLIPQAKGSTAMVWAKLPSAAFPWVVGEQPTPPRVFRHPAYARQPATFGIGHNGGPL